MPGARAGSSPPPLSIKPSLALQPQTDKFRKPVGEVVCRAPPGVKNDTYLLIFFFTQSLISDFSCVDYSELTRLDLKKGSCGF